MMVICHSDVGVVHETRGEARWGYGSALDERRGAGKGRRASGETRGGRGAGVGGGEVDRNARARGAGRGARSRLGERRARVAGSESRERARIRGRTFELLPQEEHGLVRHDGRDRGDARGDRDVRASARTPPEGVRRAGPVRASGVRVSSPRSEGSRGRAGRASKAARVRSTTDARRPGEGGPSRRGRRKSSPRFEPRPRARISLRRKKIRSRWPTPRGAGGGAHSSWRTRRTRARRCGRPTAAAWASLSR